MNNSIDFCFEEVDLDEIPVDGVFINFFKATVLLINITAFASLFSLYIVAKYLYYPMCLQFENSYKNDPDCYDYDTFLFKDLEEFNDLKTKDLSNSLLKELKTKFIKQNTKYGDVIINYDYENEGFNYYSKNANTIPYEYLEVVSRIYVMKYDCKKLYIYDESCSDDDLGVDNKDLSDNELKNNINDDKINNVFYTNANVAKKTNVNIYCSNKYKYKGTTKEFMKKYTNKIYYFETDNSEFFYLNYSDSNDNDNDNDGVGGNSSDDSSFDDIADIKKISFKDFKERNL